jgi:hypothetical protein
MAEMVPAPRNRDCRGQAGSGQNHSYLSDKKPLNGPREIPAKSCTWPCTCIVRTGTSRHPGRSNLE